MSHYQKAAEIKNYHGMGHDQLQSLVDDNEKIRPLYDRMASLRAGVDNDDPEAFEAFMDAFEAYHDAREQVIDRLYEGVTR